MPEWLVLIVIGVILICAAYYLSMPPEIKSVCRFGGIVALILGVAWATWVLLLQRVI
jgi:threonine/homoserine efflux transporter RhtA